MAIKESELVLKVSDNVNPAIWDSSKYEHFMDIIFNKRFYQKEATEIALRYLNSGEYRNLTDLAKENFLNNSKIREYYENDFQNMQSALSLENMLSATIDLATGTGKSYVMYAIAVIMLASHKVDKVLILTPSVTIERELKEKFKSLSSIAQLNNSLGVNFIPPKIIDGSETIVNNSIAIENRDAIYKVQTQKNSIVDSLNGNGEKTLILNDEVHHVYYSEGNKWAEFIKDVNNQNIKFKYVLGFTGTAYSNYGASKRAFNSYLPNVIYRFSLGDAIKKGYVKDIDYVSKVDMPSDPDERWQMILQSHDSVSNDIRNKIDEKPITIIVTNRQRRATTQANKFKEFLMKERNISSEEANKIVLCVHSGDSAAKDRLKLRDVDNRHNPVEFIFSVSMLTEGWDVKRVFQIVPDEERAFDSKLLISQVMGRGLRIPRNWNFSKYGQPVVRVFNHEKWSENVKSLVDEILEFKKVVRLHVKKESSLNFKLLNLTYTSEEQTKNNYLKMGSYELFKDGYIQLPTDSAMDNKQAEFTSVKDSKITSSDFEVKHKQFSISDMANIMYQRFDDVEDNENRDEYKKLWPPERLEKVIRKSLEKSGNTVITKKIKNRLLGALNVINRPSSKRIAYNTLPDNFFTISTQCMPKQSADITSFRESKTLFYTDDFIDNQTDNGTKSVFEELIGSQEYNHEKVDNKYYFKTPVNGVIATRTPEKKFFKRLFSKNVSKNIDSFVKSTDVGFYSFEYSWRKGSHHKTNLFNPDFFIKMSNLILVIDIKEDGQINNPDPENVGKYKYAINHFDLINDYLKNNNENVSYKFSFLTPKSFDVFFDKIEKNEKDSLLNFNSDLDVKLNDSFSNQD